MAAWDEVYAIVQRIPAGKVMNYGQIARLLKRPLSARAVGWAMHRCPEGIPWHRVVSASGRCSTDSLPTVPPGYQRALLEAEGVEFDPDGCVRMHQHRWNPPEQAKAG